MEYGHLKCITSAGSVCGFVEHSDVATPTCVHAETGMLEAFCTFIST